MLFFLSPVLFRDLWFRMNDLYPRKLWAATVHYMCANRQAHTFFPSKVTQVKPAFCFFIESFLRRKKFFFGLVNFILKKKLYQWKLEIYDLTSCFQSILLKFTKSNQLFLHSGRSYPWSSDGFALRQAHFWGRSSTWGRPLYSQSLSRGLQGSSATAYSRKSHPGEIPGEFFKCPHSPLEWLPFTENNVWVLNIALLINAFVERLRNKVFGD